MANFNMLAPTAASQYGAITLQQLIAAGFTRKQIEYRVKAGQLTRHKGGVFVMCGSAPCWEQDVAVAVLAARDEGAASHRTASRFYGFRTVDSEIEVSILHPRKLTVPGAIVHRIRDLTDGDVTWVDGLRVTTPERTICDLGLVLPETEVMRILRHAISEGLVNRYDLTRMRIRIGIQGRTGAGIVGRCLDQLPELADQTESGVEVMFLELCRDNVLPAPVLQLPLIANGKRYRVDFAYPKQRVFIEIDGRSIHSQEDQIARDGGRQNDLVAMGWHPIRFTYEKLKLYPAACAETVRHALFLWPECPDYEGIRATETKS